MQQMDQPLVNRLCESQELDVNEVKVTAYFQMQISIESQKVKQKIPPNVDKRLEEITYDSLEGLISAGKCLPKIQTKKFGNLV